MRRTTGWRAPAADCEQGRQSQQGGLAVIDGKDGMPPVKTKAEWLCNADEPDDKGRHEQQRHVVAVDEPVAANPRQQPRHAQRQVIPEDVRYEIDKRQQQKNQEQPVLRDGQSPAQEQPLPQP